MYDPGKLFVGLADEIVEIFNAPIDLKIDPIGSALLGKEEREKDDEHST